MAATRIFLKDHVDEFHPQCFSHCLACTGNELDKIHTLVFRHVINPIKVTFGYNDHKSRNGIFEILLRPEMNRGDYGSPDRSCGTFLDGTCDARDGVGFPL